ncbi:MAG: hypothetical protein WC370_04415 [Dehalococcoidales bacterium]|jgi:hypothetical protein
MNTIWKLVCVVCLAALVILAVAGCGSSKPSLVGKWQSNDDASNYIEFTKDGNLVVDINDKLITGTYEVLSDTVVKVNVSGVTGLLQALFAKGTWEYTVTKTDLTLTGDILTRYFTRVK